MNITKLFAKLKMMKADGSYLREISRIEKQNLLILDDFGLQSLDNQNSAALMELIEDRHGRRSTIITSQLPVKEWYEVIGEKTVADYPHFYIMRSNLMVCIVNQILSRSNFIDFFA